MDVKPCSKCSEIKPLDQFSPDARTPSGRQPRCKACAAEAVRKSRAANPQGHRASSQKWQSENPDQVRANRIRYKARKRGAVIGPVDVAAVLASTSNCYLCLGPLLGEVHLDHIVPLARGGAHCTDNLLPTHASCNRRKSDTLLPDLEWYVGPVELGVSL